MEPLDRLQASARRLAAGELSARAHVAGADEFGQLGQAFDGMASNIERKFHMFELLSRLDRAILASSEREPVVETLLQGVGRAIPAARPGLVVVDEDGSGVLFAPAGGESPGLRRIALDAHEVSSLRVAGGGKEVDPDLLSPASREALGEAALSLLCVFPAYVGGRLDSLLLLGFAQAPQHLADIFQAGRSLADRVAIGASSIARERMLFKQAHYDSLTGLPNRHLLQDRMEQSIAHADRSGTSVALLFIDLDGFKQVNDSLGHSRGDSLLVEYAQRLRSRMRQSDTVARLGGDEFVVLVPGLARDTAYFTVDRMARDLSRILAEPFQLGDRQLVAPASIGIALYPENASSHEELLKMADEAMYESKRREIGDFCFYTSNISALTRERFELSQELREAVGGGQLLLHYQPKFHARTGRLAGAEALLRWQSPRRGLVMPGQFIDLLDEMGLGTWLGEWVLDRACAQMHEWDQQGYRAFPVSINFSPVQFERTPVPARVRTTLGKYRLSASRLEVEILESVAASELPRVREDIASLRDSGVRVALDDFGTGFSSLVHLTRVPADIIKLDRIFLSELCTDARQRALVEMIISMAKVLDLEVVAEGVETEQQRSVLPGMGCDLLQGYLLGRPVPPEEFAARWLSADAGAISGHV
nr:EAL domain-containing protein [Lysobacter sp. CAU 1642]